ncbi:MAG: tetratricopeptide repeat protein [Proteobacteria bacterium]|nr:tetratricopeptide repeat protein [Pseudomonadota bacterium]
MRRKIKVILLLLSVILFSSCSSYRAYRTAENLMSQGKYDEAITYYNKALQDSPGDIEYVIKLARAKEASAQLHFDKGRKLLSDGKLDEAEKEFNLVLVLDPTFKRAFEFLQDIKIKKEAMLSLEKAKVFYSSNKIKEAIDEAKRAYSLNTELVEAKTLADRLLKESAKSPLEYELNIKSTKPVTLKFKDAPIKDVFEILSKLSGVNFLFDEQIRDNKVTIFIEQASFVQALELLLFTNKLALKVINQKNAIVYPDNKQKRKEYDEYYIKTFFLKYADAKKVVNTLRNLIEARQIFVNEDTNSIIVRSDLDSLELADKIIQANDMAKAEVLLDLEFVEVNRNDLERLGVDFNPYSIGAGFGKGRNPTAIVENSNINIKTGDTLLTIKDLEIAKINRNILFTLPYITINFLKQNGVTKTLANPQIKTLDGGKSQVLVGDRVPVITVTVSGADQRSENVQYVDVGVKFNVEPKILSNDEVELKIEAEVSNIVSESKTQNGTTVYRIGTRNAKTTLRVKDGETTVLGGLIQNRLERARSGIAFLSDIPVIGSLFTSYTNKIDQADIFISITPRITKGVIYPTADVTNIWSGTEDRLSAKPMLRSIVESQETTEDVQKREAITG